MQRSLTDISFGLGPDALVATPRGEVRAADLGVGDPILTRDNGIQKLRWCGSRIGAATVRVGRSALGKAQPHKSLTLGSAHCLLWAAEEATLYFEDREVFVMSGDMLREPHFCAGEADVALSSFLFDAHEVILANGIWVETFLPDPKGVAAFEGEMAETLTAALNERSTRIPNPYGTARKVLDAQEVTLLF